jgi:hypothetical protein
MKTLIPIVWAEMQARAHEYARDGKRPDREGAQELIASIIREENIIPRPPQEVVDMYAGAFLAMIDDIVRLQPQDEKQAAPAEAGSSDSRVSGASETAILGALIGTATNDHIESAPPSLAILDTDAE